MQYTPEEVAQLLANRINQPHYIEGMIRKCIAESGLTDLLLSWKPIETAPSDGRVALVYRPLARNSLDEPVALKRLIGGNNHCWESTVPEGSRPCNPTDGSCHVTHWAEIPEPVSQ